MIVIGLLSGTSADGIDSAAAELAVDGDTLQLTPLGHAHRPYSDDLRHLIVEAYPPRSTTAEAVCRIDTAVGQEFAAAATDAVDAIGGHPDLIASHGQTVFHWIDDGAAAGSLQLGQPAWIAEATGLPVVSDLRAADIAAGGHGAPLAGLLDAYLLADRTRPAAALNLGGIANVTVLAADGSIHAFDTGPANALLDVAIADATGGAQTADLDGRRAANGRVDERLLAVLLDEPYYHRAPPKSTGKELFDPQYLQAAVDSAGAVDTDDVLATLVEVTANTVADALRPYGVREVLVSGGGTHNPVLMRRLRDVLAPAIVVDTAGTGIDGDAKEAYLFALIGFLTWHGLPGSLPGCTGARRAAIAGRITPGHGPIRMPEPLPRPPRRLQITDAEAAATDGSARVRHRADLPHTTGTGGGPGRDRPTNSEVRHGNH